MTNPLKSSPESPAKEQPGEQNAAPQVPEPSPFGEVSHHKPAVAAPDEERTHANNMADKVAKGRARGPLPPPPERP